MHIQLLKPIDCFKIFFKSNLFLSSEYYAEACNEFARLISTSLRPGNKPPFKEMPQRRAIGNNQFD